MEAKFVDVHAHVADKAFDESRDKLAAELDGFIVLNSGEDPAENAKILNDSKKHVSFLPCIGLHPNKVSVLSKEKIAEGVNYIVTHINEAFAVSEVGLDYRGKDESQKALQKKAFEEILALAELKGKVCIVHSRKSIEDVVRTISSFRARVIIHNFEGNQAQYLKAVEANAYISVSTAFIKFKRDSLIKKIALDRLFVETDSPVLSPDENMNTPLNIRKILKYVADLRGMREEELKEAVWDNFRRVFYG